MTLSQFLAIFSSRQKLCLTILVGALLLSLAMYRLQSQSYSVTLLLSVARSSSDETPDYKYDQFYRLQADERFADTIVRYLGTEVGKRDIVTRADLSPLDASDFFEHSIQASRLSSQIVTVSARTRTIRAGEKIAASLPEAVNGYAASLNREARVGNWFLVVPSDSVIVEGRFSWRLAVTIGLLVGLFLAFWTALGDHFLKGERRELR
ncbi:MAG: hypothetical protein ABI747_03865 [Candidatus Moraniibacteriota bacterium]